MSAAAYAILRALLDPTALTVEAVRVPVLPPELAREVEARVRAAVGEPADRHAACTDTARR